MTSGGTPEPRLADELAVLANNLYGFLPGAPPLGRLAEMFAAAGWHARASSWTDIEVESEWLSIEVQQLPDEVIFSGVVDPARLDELGTVFTSFGLRYSIELWSAEGSELIRELSG